MGKIIDALRKLGTKLTGKSTIDSNSIATVLNDIADDYEGGGGTEYIDLVYTEDEASLTQEQITKLQNGAFIKLYQETEGESVLMGVAIPADGGNYATSCIALDKPERTVYYGITIIGSDTYKCFTVTLVEAGSADIYNHYIKFNISTGATYQLKITNTNNTPLNTTDSISSYMYSRTNADDMIYVQQTNTPAQLADLKPAYFKHYSGGMRFYLDGAQYTVQNPIDVIVKGD